MWEPFERYSQLEPEARRIFRRALCLLPWIALSLRLRGFQRTRDALQKKLNASASGLSANGTAEQKATRTSRMVTAGARYGIVRANCLVESLALWYLLGEQNLSARLRIGVRKQKDRLEAHAWVEWEGVALNQTEAMHLHYEAFEGEFPDRPGERP